MSTGLEVRSMVFLIYNNFTGIKSNFWVVQAAVTGESLGAFDERFTWNDLQILKECSVKMTENILQQSTLPPDLEFFCKGNKLNINLTPSTGGKS